MAKAEDLAAVMVILVIVIYALFHFRFLDVFLETLVHMPRAETANKIDRT